MRTDCFAYQSDTCCRALTEMVCAFKDCPFYKQRKPGTIYSFQHYVKHQDGNFCMMNICGHELIAMVDGGHTWLRIANLRYLLGVNCQELVIRKTPVTAHMMAFTPATLGGRSQKNMFLRADYLEEAFKTSRLVDRTVLAKLVEIFKEAKA